MRWALAFTAGSMIANIAPATIILEKIFIVTTSRVDRRFLIAHRL
jgi:hypothetical protein